MNRIIKIGMDVHSTNYTLCAMEPVLGAEDRIYGELQVAPDYKAIVAFIASIKMKLGLSDKYSFECGLYSVQPAHECRYQMCHSCADDYADAEGKADQDRQEGCPSYCTMSVLWRV